MLHYSKQILGEVGTTIHVQIVTPAMGTLIALAMQMDLMLHYSKQTLGEVDTTIHAPAVLRILGVIILNN